MPKVTPLGSDGAKNGQPGLPASSIHVPRQRDNCRANVQKAGLEGHTPKCWPLFSPAVGLKMLFSSFRSSVCIQQFFFNEDVLFFVIKKVKRNNQHSVLKETVRPRLQTRMTESQADRLLLNQRCGAQTRAHRPSSLFSLLGHPSPWHNPSALCCVL